MHGQIFPSITSTCTIDEAPQAFADLAAGRNARGVIVFG
jgi:S-(hydroxymethyl)glutathione dehydrogenase/alcohol dehydrogenase